MVEQKHERYLLDTITINIMEMLMLEAMTLINQYDKINSVRRFALLRVEYH